MVPRGSPIRGWADLKQPRPGGGRWTVGVLAGSAADTFAAEQGGETSGWSGSTARPTP